MNISGAYTALVTPFDSEGNLDEAGLRRNIQFQIGHGIDGVVPVGTTGESPTLTPEEHERVIEIAVEESKGKCKVLAGTGSNSTDEAIHYTKFAKKVGADAALVVGPYYNKPSQEGMYQHYKAVAEEADMPTIIYNVPSRTGKNIEAETTLRLANDVKNIIAVKEASCNLDQIMRIAKEMPSDFALLSGEDSWSFPIMALGGCGVISVASNLIPSATVEMVHKFLDGDIDGSRQLHNKYLDLMKVIFIESNPTPVKKAMELMGMPSGKPRLPLVSVTSQSEEKIKKVLSDLALI
jgi:4-hydroxy-tetrahydrodipicolinate synthase